MIEMGIRQTTDSYNLPIQSPWITRAKKLEGFIFNWLDDSGIGRFRLTS